MLPVLRGICGATVVAVSMMALPLSAQETAGDTPAAESTPAAPVSGQVYRTVDAQGRVIFTDAPPADRSAEPVRIHNTNTVPTLHPGETVKPPPAAAAQGYERFVMTSPAHDAVLGQDIDKVTLVAEVSPGLQTGHTIQFFYDGRPVGQRSTELVYVVSELERGTHTVQARIFDSKGVELQATGAVQFHVRRISALNKVSTADKGKDDEKKGWLRQLWGRGATAPNDMEPVGGYGAPKGVGSLAGAGKPGGAGSPQDVGSLGPK